MEIATDITELKLLHAELSAAKKAAETLARTDSMLGCLTRGAFADIEFNGEDGFLNPTMSFGVAGFTGDDEIDQWLNKADKALYRAKALGRDRVEVAI